jgi:hypothetical protein
MFQDEMARTAWLRLAATQRLSGEVAGNKDAASAVVALIASIKPFHSSRIRRSRVINNVHVEDVGRTFGRRFVVGHIRPG